MGKQPNLRDYVELAYQPPSVRLLEHFYKGIMGDQFLKHALEGVGKCEGLDEYGPVRHGKTKYAFAYIGMLDLGNVAILFPEERKDRLKVLLKNESCLIGTHSLDELLMQIVACAQAYCLRDLSHKLRMHEVPGD